jgi:hypothetical protein
MKNVVAVVARVVQQVQSVGLRVIPPSYDGDGTVLAAQRRIDRRGRYADPWTLITNKYGHDILARRDQSDTR